MNLLKTATAGLHVFARTAHDGSAPWGGTRLRKEKKIRQVSCHKIRKIG